MRFSLAAKSLAAIGLAALAAGCSTPVAPEGGVRIDGQNNVSPTLNSVRVIDGSLARYVGRNYRVDSVLDVERAFISPTPTGFPRVTVELRNKTGVILPLEVRTHWYDAAGRPVDRPTSWTQVFAQPASMALYEQVSISPASTQYYVEVRGAE
jgi:hypothetical protein